MAHQRAKRYTLERSIDHTNWKHVAGFEEGQPSRFGEPFDQNIAIAEAISYRDRESRYRHPNEKEFVRIIIEI
ncbi:hypothetical protein [uncultured Clostridium sp.]|uniref:hypothetical protein n=1 Tax=uncultured Clostridium sp. TaxID=59620 RepID=UPI002605859E|nr:hypothetical protein [uncultured Clostridium sp.]